MKIVTLQVKHKTHTTTKIYAFILMVGVDANLPNGLLLYDNTEVTFFFDTSVTIPCWRGPLICWIPLSRGKSDIGHHFNIYAWFSSLEVSLSVFDIFL